MAKSFSITFKYDCLYIIIDSLLVRSQFGYNVVELLSIEVEFFLKKLFGSLTGSKSILPMNFLFGFALFLLAAYKFF